MTHTEFTMLMSAVLDHEAPPGDQRKLQEHLSGCPACSQTWARWQELNTYLSAAPVVAPPPGFALHMAGRLEAERQRAHRRRWLGSGLLMAWAGSIAVLWLVLLGLVVWGYTHPLDLGRLAASGVQTLSGLADLMNALRSAIEGLGFLPVSLGVGFYVGVTALVAGGWLWLMAHKSAWAQIFAVSADVPSLTAEGR